MRVLIAGGSSKDCASHVCTYLHGDPSVPESRCAHSDQCLYFHFLPPARKAMCALFPLLKWVHSEFFGADLLSTVGQQAEASPVPGQGRALTLGAVLLHKQAGESF